jgi:hypothetical protein
VVRVRVVGVPGPGDESKCGGYESEMNARIKAQMEGAGEERKGSCAGRSNGRAGRQAERMSSSSRPWRTREDRNGLGVCGLCLLRGRANNSEDVGRELERRWRRLMR